MGMTQVLVVDDEKSNRINLKEDIEDFGYRVTLAEDGQDGWDKMEKEPERYDIVLLDIMMPKMNGLEVLSVMKGHPLLKEIPTILQTAKAAPDDMAKGIDAGAYYYLVKPYSTEVLHTIIQAAVRDSIQQKNLKEEISRAADTLHTLIEGEFHFQTLKQASGLASLLSKACPFPSRAAFGLLELLINAVEHGNLGISYDEKSELLKEECWEKEVEHRLTMPEYCQKIGKLFFKKESDRITFLIEDEGNGFEWKKYFEFNLDRMTDSHGRGIFISNESSFDSLEYLGVGNKVQASISLSTKAKE